MPGNDIFETDIELQNETAETEASTGFVSHLWPNGAIPYTFSDDLRK